MRSILKACFIVHNRSHCCIGTNHSISILYEQWLVNGDHIDGNIVEVNFVRDFPVNSLMNTSSNGWNEVVIQQVFCSNIANSFLRTLLIDQVVDDRLIWKSEKNGLYSVKSAYRLCAEELVYVSHIRLLGYWYDIWRLKVPPKVKNLIWKMCRGCLPTRVWLQVKGVQYPTICLNCGGLHEDLAHICFEFPFTMQVWCRARLWNVINEAFLEMNSVVDAIFKSSHQLLQEFGQWVAAIL